MKRLQFAFALACLLAGARLGFSLSLSPATPDERVQNAAAICHATVLGAESFRGADGGIHTRTWLRVNETFKGKFPTTITVVHRGGRVGEAGEVSSDAPRLNVGDERFFLLGQRADGTLFVDNGSTGAPPLARAGGVKAAGTSVTDPTALALLSAARSRYPTAAGPDLTGQAAASLMPQAVTGLLTSSGVSQRFIAGDRGEPIEYLVDADTLPTGLTQAQALGAVSNAFRAWANVTSLRFQFAGVTSFGTNAHHVSTNVADGRIRVQLHDTYGFVTGSSVLGVGGNSFSISPTFPNGGMGGNVNSNEFYPVTGGYLVMKHTQTSLQTLATFEEVLCHEIGHVLSMAHSSESSGEPDGPLRQAMMFFQVHADGRGATLGSYDPPVVQQAYPTNNTPPYGYDRVMDIITQPSGVPNIAGINQIELRGYDLQGHALTVSTNNYLGGSGSFALSGSSLSFSLASFTGGSRLNPADGSYYRSISYRFSDGTNASPFYTARVISLQPDQNPGGASDGLPDDWVAQYFGSASASVNPSADADGDGVSNINEFRLGTNPTNAASVLRFSSSSATGLNWFATAYEVYEVEATTDFTNWFRAGNPVVPTTTNGSFTNFPASTNRLFFRVLRVP